MRLLLAFKVFFLVLFRGEVAAKVRDLLEKNSSDKVALPTAVPKSQDVPSIPRAPAAPRLIKSATRSEALTLLSTLQREARLIDLVSESLDGYSDAQIGAAARDVLRDSKKTLDRLFGLAALVDKEEGSSIAIPPDHSPVRWRLVGKENAAQGTLTHPGWVATKSEMPQWSGLPEDAMVIAAAEVET
jgi:hypothetical protein